MKKNSLLFVLCLVLSNSFAQEVLFRELSWQDANNTAAKENKYIFVDAYTDWCGWCKVMDKKLFTDEIVATLINEKFIPLKINFEDSAGIILAKKFRVWSYPTTLVFNPSGQLINKFSGYTEDKQQYIDFLNACLSNKEERVFGFDSRILDLEYPALYNNLFNKERKRWPSDSMVSEYLRGKDLFSEVSWSVLLRFSPKEYEEFVFSNHDKYKQLYGLEEVRMYANRVIQNNLNLAIKEDNSASLQKALDLCKYVDKPEDSRQLIMLAYCKEKKDWNGLITQIENYVARNGVTLPDNINNNCWSIYEECDDQTILLKATALMKPVAESHPEYMYLDTYAALLYKTRNYAEALKYADLALTAAESEKVQDITSTKELKKNILKEIELR